MNTNGTHNEKVHFDHWLDADSDRFAALHAQHSCCELVDIQNDGEGELLLATADNTLRRYKNSRIHSEVKLPDTPAAMCSFMMDRQSSIPCLAVASGSYVFVYRHFKPFFKFKVPQEELDEREKAIWDRARSTAATELKTQLRELQNERGYDLSTRSKQILSLESNEEAEGFVDRVASVPLTKSTVVTCMSKVKRNSLEKLENDHLILGTASGQLLVLQSGARAIEEQYSIPSVPVAISSKGIWETESRIVVGCRNGRVYTIRNKKKMKTEFDTSTTILGLCLIQQELYVACTDQSLHCYHEKGRKLWSLRFSKYITAIFPLSVATVDACLVGFIDGRVKSITSACKEVFQEIGTEKGSDPVSVLRFGRFGREDHCLIIGFNSGALKICIIPRLVIEGVHWRLCWSFPKSFASSESEEMLDIPKKTLLYVEQTQRERTAFRQMHYAFQKKLCRLRLETARAYAQLVSSGCDHMSAQKSKRVEANPRVQGIGPHFVLYVDITNKGKEVLSGTMLIFNFARSIYSVSPPQLHLPVLLPTMTCTFSVDVHAAQGEPSGQILCMLCDSSDEGVPLVSLLVKMPRALDV